MATIRESVTVEPITSEELDIAGNIHRYNFGWMVTRSIVGGGGGGGDGIVVEHTTTGISGIGSPFQEIVTQQILPPSLTTPMVGAETEMSSGIVVGSYYKTGTKRRMYTKAKVFGTSELIVMGENQFSVIENKVYADAAGGGNQIDPSGGGGADGGVTISVANGVQTITHIRG